jgi:hypothetical protein
MASREMQTIFSTVADGRTKDLRYRQRQFISLHRWITSHLAEIESAICKDDGLSESAASFTMTTALQELGEYYNALSLKQHLQDEYRVKHGRDNPDGRSPRDLVYILPDTFTLFYGVMCALYPCIAAGSCCVVEVSTARDGSAPSRRLNTRP